MPYKTKQREAVRIAVSKKRQGITLLHRPNGPDYDPEELLPDGSKRYMGPFTDGQVLDRTTVDLSHMR